jgi:hypothetical protein
MNVPPWPRSRGSAFGSPRGSRLTRSYAASSNNRCVRPFGAAWSCDRYTFFYGHELVESVRGLSDTAPRRLAMDMADHARRCVPELREAARAVVGREPGSVLNRESRPVTRCPRFPDR